jgi:hypothetical protein
MSALVTDQFRILNASNFIDSVENPANSYYVFVGLTNPTTVGFARTSDWDTNPPAPVDNFSYLAHDGDIMMFGKKLSSANVRRIIRRIDWVSGTKYEMYRNDYSVLNPSPLTAAYRLYDANYYVMNSDYRVYICIDNGATGSNPLGNASQDQPTFTDLEPSRAGNSGDGYVWKYLFSVSPSDIIKFDSTEYITVPNDWNTTNDTQITAIRENGNSDVNANQIKKVYIQNAGANYSNGLDQEVNILGDGSGAKVRLDITGGKIVNTNVSSGGQGYSYGIVDLGGLNSNSSGNFATLVPIIPPSKGHGFNIYTELGTDRILAYARFDDSTKNFPIDAKFAQVGILKNPTSIGSTQIYYDDTFSSLYCLKLTSLQGTPQVGEKIYQYVTGGRAVGYVASFDIETNVLKYFRDRSLFWNQTTLDQTDYIGISTSGKIFNFDPTSPNNVVGSRSGFSAAIDVGFTGITTNPTGSKLINLGVNFTNGVAVPQINKGSGEIIYIDNRPLINRNSRQKEDIKIVLEF